MSPHQQPVPEPARRQRVTRTEGDVPPGAQDVPALRMAAVPHWVHRVTAYSLAVLAVAGVCWLLGLVLLRLALVSFTLAVAVLLTALLSPLAGRLRRAGAPRALAAMLALFFLLAVPVGIGFLLWARLGNQVQDLRPAVAAGINDIRTWLTTGPLSLDTTQINNLRHQAVDFIERGLPAPSAGARTALHVLTSLALALFTVFFFLKDGERMWQWVLERTAEQHRRQVDGAGRRAWDVLTGYVVGVTVIALIDAVLIGAGLLLVGVPLWVSLTLLTFVGAFVPILGATVSGAVAVLVTMVSNGTGDAVIVLVVVLVVQQVEGNLLQPLVMGRAVHLHPVVTLVAVTCGTLLFGISGTVLAVPVVAVTYGVAEYLRKEQCSPAVTPRARTAPSPPADAVRDSSPL